MHIGLIPDGNRRYMRKKGITGLGESYGMGISKFYDFLEWCMKLGVKEVTIYALSTENIENRGKIEIDTLISVFTDQSGKALTDDRIHKNKIKVKVCGDLEYLSGKANNPQMVRKLEKKLGELEAATKDYSNFTLNLAIGYGGRQEIINAVKNVLKKGLELNEENIKENLWVKDYPELIIRTAEDRLSNFLLWQSAYSEICFVDKLWQEFEEEDLVNIVKEYSSRERRFGK